MTCKDCLHYEACKGTYSTSKEMIDEDSFDNEHYADIYSCPDFADRSEWVHLPKVGDKLYKLVPDLEKSTGNMTIQEYTVSGIIASVIVFKPYNVFNMYRNRIGVDIFLTREEAEKVLEEKQNGYK